MVRLDPDLVADLLASVRKTFTLAARNPARSRRFGGQDLVFAPVGGPAYVMDIERGRRDGTSAGMCDFLRLIQVLNVVQHEGGGPFEPMDLATNTRHLDICLAQITLLDKSWQTQTLGLARTMDGIEMAATLFGCAPEKPAGQPVGDHQHELSAATGCGYGRGVDRAGPVRAGERDHAVFAGGCHGAGFYRRGAGFAACQGDGRHLPDADCQEGGAGDVWRVHLERGHAVGRASLRDAGICQGGAGLWPVGAPDRAAVPVEQRDGGQCGGRAGGL